MSVTIDEMSKQAYEVSDIPKKYASDDKQKGPTGIRSV